MTLLVTLRNNPCVLLIQARLNVTLSPPPLHICSPALTAHKHQTPGQGLMFTMIVTLPGTIKCLLWHSQSEGQSNVYYSCHTGRDNYDCHTTRDNPPFTTIVTLAGTIHCLVWFSHRQGQSAVYYDCRTGRDSALLSLIVTQAGQATVYYDCHTARDNPHLFWLSHSQGQSNVYCDCNTASDNPMFTMIVTQPGTIQCLLWL